MSDSPFWLWYAAEFPISTGRDCFSCVLNWIFWCDNLMRVLWLQVFVAISLILGDGLYNLIKIIAITFKETCKISTRQKDLPIFKEVLGKEWWSMIIYFISFILLCHFLLTFITTLLCCLLNFWWNELCNCKFKCIKRKLKK